ncbi:MAG: NAD(P)-dependent alcohol dehydrogenase [Desulfovibrionales bacterium]
MKAAFYSLQGGEEVIEIGEFPEPGLGAGQVLIRVKAASVNPVDWKIREGMLSPVVPSRLPRITGSDFAGVVEAVGSKVRGYSRGDRVLGSTNPATARYGSFAELTVASQERVGHLPDELDFETGAALPIAGVTALQAIRDSLLLKPERTVLVNGASGGVGHFAVQIAGLMGAKVTGTCSRENMDFVRELGADQVIDYRTKEYRQSCFDSILDAAAKLSFAEICSMLNLGGRHVTTVPDSMIVGLSLFGPVLPKRFSFLLGRPNPKDLETLAAWCVREKLRVHISRSFSLEETDRAQEASRSGHTRGKLLVRLD